MKKKKKVSQEDISTWEKYLENPTDIINKDRIEKNDYPKNPRFKYDLHGYTLASANIRVEEIILSCIKNNFKEILLITGKGIHSNTEENTYVSKDLSKLKYSVPEYIKTNLDLAKHILSITSADKKDGGEGAIIIKLKKL